MVKVGVALGGGGARGLPLRVAVFQFTALPVQVSGLRLERSGQQIST
jgi:hypothetical protein